MTTVHSFAPLAAPGARCLVLGSMPGKASLAAQQYYAHPRNLFWQLMEELYAIDRALPYADRCQALTAAGIALWDVLQACTRSSSLDSDIVESSIVTNDFVAFLYKYPDINAIYFNGAKAEQVFNRYVLDELSGPMAGIPRTRLPSTSPANASITLAAKRKAWAALVAAGHQHD